MIQENLSKYKAAASWKIRSSMPDSSFTFNRYYICFASTFLNSNRNKILVKQIARKSAIGSAI